MTWMPIVELASRAIARGVSGKHPGVSVTNNDRAPGPASIVTHGTVTHLTPAGGACPEW